MINLKEKDRLEKLLSYNILDTEEEKDFDELVNLASKICKTPISLISLIDDKRQWFKAHHGIDVRETPREISFCQHAIQNSELFIVSDASLDIRFKENPLVLGSPDIRFYAGMPLTTIDGYNLGTLCVIDTVPRVLNEEQIEALEILSKQVTKQLDLKVSLINEKNYSAILKENHLQLEEANAIKDKIFNIVAHDMRTPLLNIKNILEMYEEGEFDKENLDSFLNNIANKVKFTSEMLENLLHWAKLQMKNSKADFTQFDIAHLIEIEANKFKINAAEKGIVLNVSFAEKCFIVADIEMIKIVLRNLLSNAIKFCKAGDTINIVIENEEDKIIVHVKDTGKGIKNTQNIFSENASESTFGTKSEKGIGIGLKLCKAFLNKNNGEIWVESEENAGSIFSFSIPKIK